MAGLRKDFELIEAAIPREAKVLDLGCGDGALLAYLRDQKQIIARGIEVDLTQVVRAIRKGIAVYHGDIKEGLSYFSKGTFDVVVLSRTIHQVWHWHNLLPAIFRVGKQVIVSFMNYGYYRNRIQFFLRGVVPRSASFPYEWHTTPNLRFFSIRDFESYCLQNKLKVRKRLFYKHQWKRPSILMPNMFAECAIYVLEPK